MWMCYVYLRLILRGSMSRTLLICLRLFALGFGLHSAKQLDFGSFLARRLGNLVEWH